MSKTPPPSGVTITYQYQFRKCGKASCNTCNKPDSKGHGGYFYGYYRLPGEKKLRVYYYGKQDPRSDAQKAMDAKKRELKQYGKVKAEVTV